MKNLLTSTQTKIGIFSDVHLGNYKDDPLWHKIAIDMAQWAADEYKKQGISEIIIAGDLFHDRFEINTKTIGAAVAFLEKFKDFKVYIITGNHDCFFKENSKVHSLAAFSKWSNIHIVDKLTTLQTPNRKLQLCPWGTEPSELAVCDAAIGHWDIKGFYYSKGKVCEKGLNPLEFLEKTKLVITGHFHAHDHRQFPEGLIIYTGSPYQLNWGEHDHTKYIFVLDTETNVLHKFENKVSPRHYKIMLSDRNAMDGVIEGNIIQLVVDYDAQEEDIASAQAAIGVLKPLNFKITYQAVDHKLNIAETQTSFDIGSDIQVFVDSMEMPSELRQKVATAAIGLYNSLNS